jgi:hypothetical protein
MIVRPRWPTPRMFCSIAPDRTSRSTGIRPSRTASYESLDNLTPTDVYFGRTETILLERERIKRKTIANRRLQPKPPFRKQPNCLNHLTTGMLNSIDWGDWGDPPA